MLRGGWALSPSQWDSRGWNQRQLFLWVSVPSILELREHLCGLGRGFMGMMVLICVPHGGWQEA